MNRLWRMACPKVCMACMAILALGGDLRGAEEPKKGTEAQSKPITTQSGPVGELLRKWHAEGTAAGNIGDWYDNRDRGHSDLNMAVYPQLKRFEYSEEERKRRVDWAAQGRVLPLVVFGNSSTSAGVEQGGSNPRHLYSHPMGLTLLYAQYMRNNLYIYPEHRDYDPGHNGGSGYGDLYPTNTPYLIISQGSSGSDRPFMDAVALTLAAFRPEVKKRLTETGLLMPTIQMIFRMSNKQVTAEKDYLTGKAHPTVFQGSEVNVKKMVEMAHDMRPNSIPPVVQLRVVDEDQAVAGRDFFDAGGSEKLVDRPATIARIHRTRNLRRRMVVSAEESQDLNKEPLSYHWVLLRGDPALVEIKPRGEAKASAEITVAWHERRPIAEGSAMESNRVDIGAFVHNGKCYSAPGFVTVMFLDNEARTYEPDGRILEIGYGAGTTEVDAADWPALLEHFKPDAASLGAQLLKKAFTADEAAVLLKAAGEYRSARKGLTAAEEQRKNAEAAKSADAELAPLRKAENEARKVLTDVLEGRRDALRGSVKEAIVREVRKLVGDPTFYPAHAKALEGLLHDGPRKAVMEGARKRLMAWGLLAEGAPGAFVLKSIRGATTPDPGKLTRLEKCLLEQFHGELLSRLVFPGVLNCRWRGNYVDPRISTPKSWRDVYRYDPQGRLTGWTRYNGQQTSEFNAEGKLVDEKDARGRATKARPVLYFQEPAKPDPNRRRFGPNLNPLLWKATNEVVYYEYNGDADWIGHAVRRDASDEKR